MVENTANTILNSAPVDNTNGNAADPFNYMHQVLSTIENRLKSDENRALCQEVAALSGNDPALLEQWGVQIGQANGGDIAQLDRLLSMIGADGSKVFQDSSSDFLTLFSQVLSNISLLLSSSQSFDLEQLITMLSSSEKKISQIANDPSLTPLQKRKEILKILLEVLDFTQECASKANAQGEHKSSAVAKAKDLSHITSTPHRMNGQLDAISVLQA